MSHPVIFDVPHRLGIEEAKRRLQNGLGDLDRSIPGASRVTKEWRGNQLHIAIVALGQDLAARLDVEANRVEVHLSLPGLLGIIGQRIAGYFRSRTIELLEDKSGR